MPQLYAGRISKINLQYFHRFEAMNRVLYKKKFHQMHLFRKILQYLTFELHLKVFQFDFRYEFILL